jgi:hypothetical protein
LGKPPRGFVRACPPSAIHDAEEAAQAHALFSPADPVKGRLEDGPNSRGTLIPPAFSMKLP